MSTITESVRGGSKSDLSKGISLALITALVSGISVFANDSALKLADATAYTLAKNLVAVLFLVVIACVFAFKEIKTIRSLSKKQILYLVAIGIIGGGVPFAMFFWGLKLGGAAISSFIYRSLFVFAGVFGYLVLKERPEPKDIIAGFVILAGNALLIPGDLAFGLPQALVLGATMLWALEYTISRKAMTTISIDPKIVMISRLAIGSTILIALMAFIGDLGAIGQLAAEPSMLIWLVVTSSLLSAFMLAWYSTLRYLPVLKAASIFTIGGVITAILELLFMGKAISPTAGIGLALILIGAVMVARLSAISKAIADAKDRITFESRKMFFGVD